MNKFIANADLIEPQQINGSFTWSILGKRTAQSKIDRLLYSLCWQNKFLDHHVRRLQRNTSDHYHLTLESVSLKWGPCPFRFENWWLNNKTLNDNIDQWWNSARANGYPGYTIMRRLINLKYNIKSWNLNHFDKVKSYIHDINISISDIDKVEEAGNINEASLNHRIALNADLVSHTIDKARKWKQLC